MNNVGKDGKQEGQSHNRSVMRRRFMGCAAVATGTAIIGFVESGAGVDASLKQQILRYQKGPSGTLKTVEYGGIRTTDPHGLCGLRNPERGFRTETIIAEPTGRTEGVWGIPAHLRRFVGSGFSPMNLVLDIRRFAPDGVTLTQTYCYLTEFHDKPISEEKLNLIRNSFDIMRRIGRRDSHTPPLPDNTRNPIALNKGYISLFQDQLRLFL